MENYLLLRCEFLQALFPFIIKIKRFEVESVKCAFFRISFRLVKILLYRVLECQGEGLKGGVPYALVIQGQVL